MALLSIENMTVSYANSDMMVTAVNDVSIQIEKGESLGIVGESGSGKSTFVLALLRLLNEKSTKITGKVQFNDMNLLALSEKELAKIRWIKIAVVFQKAMNVFSPVHTIETFLGDIYKVHLPKTTKKELKEKLIELMSMVNLPDRVLSMYPHELSGGMLQRVSIAMSLMFHPQILFLDEATTALDVVTQSQILNEIMDLEKKLDITRIMITHDMSVVASTCKNVAVLYAGRFMEMGPVQEVLVNPKHPYTIGLIKSFPKFTEYGQEELVSIGGTLPNLADMPLGCVFAPRCNFADEICKTTVPSMTQIEGSWKCACHHIGSVNQKEGFNS